MRKLVKGRNIKVGNFIVLGRRTVEVEDVVHGVLDGTIKIRCGNDTMVMWFGVEESVLIEEVVQIE